MPDRSRFIRTFLCNVADIPLSFSLPLSPPHSRSIVAIHGEKIGAPFASRRVIKARDYTEFWIFALIPFFSYISYTKMKNDDKNAMSKRRRFGVDYVSR